MVHIVAVTNNFLAEIILSADKVFYKTIHPGRVLVIRRYGFTMNEVCDNIQNC